MKSQRQYLTEQYNKATRPEAKELVAKAIAELDAAEAAELERTLEPLKQEQAKILSEIREQENEVARQEFAQGKRDSGSTIKRVTDDTMSDKEITQAITKAFDQFRKWMDESGTQLTLEAHRKLAKYIQQNESYDIRDANVWLEALQRAIDIGIIRPDEITVPQEEPVPQPIPAPDPRTVEGRRAEKRAHYQAILQEARPVYDSFYDELSERGIYLTVDEQKALISFIEEHGLFPTQPQAWRRALRAVLPKYLSDAEKADLELSREAESLSSDEFAKRYGVRRRTYGDPIIADRQIDH